MYKKCYAKRLQGNKYLIHLWEDEGYKKLEWVYPAFKECHEADATHIGLNGEALRRTLKWKNEDSGLHFHDMTPHKRFLIEKYGTNDEVSTTHREMFFDIETEVSSHEDSMPKIKISLLHLFNITTSH